ncbi:MAG: PEP/pyruvate-binding domain-containing protein [Gaiellales bacterium]
MSVLHDHDDLDFGELERRIGGKGAKLARMQRLGCRVPSWFAVEAASFQRAMLHRDVQAALARAGDLIEQADYERAAEAVRTSVLALPLPEDLQRMVVEQWQATLGRHVVAVRSSAVGEDGTDHSFAGQFESVLGVQTEQQLLDAVRQCWASAWTGRAVAYRARHGMPPLEVEMGLVVQTLVDSEISGVMFTGDPISGDPYTTVISATWGLGEALVSGIANADTFRIDRRHDEIDVEIADKDVMIVHAAAGLTREDEVPDERRTARTLSDAQLRELVALGELLEQADAGLAQDVEWAFHEGDLHVLQTRPVTTKLRPRGIRRTWDNSNIVESYSGVVSPLTFSFAREAYTQVYYQALRLLRLPESEMDAARIVVRQMLGYIDDRVYYNLASWYYLLSVMPDYEKNAAAMEQMMGVRAPLDRRVAPPANANRKVRMYAAIGWQLLRIKSSVRVFRANVRRVLDRYDLDFRSMDADALVTAYDSVQTELLSDWQTPIVGDTRVMIMFDRLRSTIRTLGLDDDGTLHNDLMCGQGEVESAEPTYLLVRVAERIRADEHLRSLVLDTADDHLRHAIREHGGENGTWVDAQLEDYLARFGDRCANELKLETPTLREQPAFLYSVLRNFIRQDELTEARMKQHEAGIAQEAMASIEERFNASSRWLRPLRRFSFNFALKQARSAVRDREAMRFERTRVFGLCRRIFTALGERLHEAELIDAPRDVFYLEVAEIIGTVQGTTTIKDLRGLVALRKAQQETWLTDELPDRLETIGITSANPRVDAYAAVDVSGDQITGIGCCPGVVEREARVVLAPDEGVTLDGDIMVCKRTDPGWVPLFPSCGGLLVERGSLLSHSAIVAREFGIPAIVGIPGLMQWVQDGERVRMDGSAGTVEKSESVPTPDLRAEMDQHTNV